MHADFLKVKRAMKKKYGERGEEVFYKWLQKHGYDDTKPLDKQQSKATDDFVSPFYDWFDDEEEFREDEADAVAARVAKPPTEPQPAALHDQLDRLDKGAAEAKKDGTPDFISVPTFKIPYVATPKFGGEKGEIIIKALVLEEGPNVNNWRVVAEEFPRVAAQYKAGRQLRLNHGKNVQDVFGKSFDGKVLKGAEIATYLGRAIEGVRDDGLYVAAEFEATPQDAQVRANILNGYVETGSIGLNANAYCETCDKPLVMKGDEFQRTCKHFDAPVKLRDVDVKEYSYVAEPAFAHTLALPSFGAAIDHLLRSSLTPSPAKGGSDMPEPKVESIPPKTPEPSKDITAARKAEGEGEGESEADGIAKKFIAYYLKGFADAAKKYGASADDAEAPKDEKKATVTASAKPPTDQVSQVGLPKVDVPVAMTKATVPDGQSMMAKAWEPTKNQMLEPWQKEFFVAMSTAPMQDGKPTPADVTKAFLNWKREMPGVFE